MPDGRDASEPAGAEPATTETTSKHCRARVSELLTQMSGTVPLYMYFEDKLAKGGAPRSKPVGAATPDREVTHRASDMPVGLGLIPPSMMCIGAAECPAIGLIALR